MVRSTVADVDLDAIAHNLKALTDFLQAETRPAGASAPGIVAVVKANAYGHGAVPVAKALENAGATMLACADIEEAVTLRRGPFVVEHDRDHDHRAGRDRYYADQRPLFEDRDDDRSSVLCIREAPACHTHSEPPFGPQQVVWL